MAYRGAENPRNPHTSRGRVGYLYDSLARGTLTHVASGDTRPRKVRRQAARDWAKLERQAQRGAQ